jgi:AGZA family xanthine/uracil permease-like MFS transporter
MAGVGVGTTANPFRQEILDGILKARNFHAEGMFALEQGYFLSCLILSAATVCIIDQKFRQAAVWFAAGALLAAVGFIHSFGFITADIVGVLKPGWKWVIGYLAMSGVMLAVPIFMEKSSHEAV